MVGVAVVVADDVEPGVVCLALDADVIEGIDLVTVARSLDDDVPRAANLGDGVFARRSDHDPADFVGIALGAMRLDGFERRTPNFHRCP